MHCILSLSDHPFDTSHTPRSTIYDQSTSNKNLPHVPVTRDTPAHPTQKPSTVGRTAGRYETSASPATHTSAMHAPHENLQSFTVNFK